VLEDWRTMGPTEPVRSASHAVLRQLRESTRQQKPRMLRASTNTADRLGGELDQMRRRKEELESEVTNLANAIAQGDFSPALRRALADRERQIGEITTKLLEASPDSLRSKLRNIRSFVMTRMQDLRAVPNSDVGHVRAELAKHIDQITLTPTGDAYVASGTWNFVGRGSIGGAGGQNRTGYARLFRAALYQ
jgi:hypothetical protein